MKPIDWRQVLTDHHVPFVERGANVKRGELNIRCPMCGAADPSFHLGLNPETGFWACWRNSNHRGKSPLRLLVALLNVPYGVARKIAGISEDSWRDPDGFDAMAARLMGRVPDMQLNQVQREFLQFPREFREIKYDGLTSRAWDYLALDRDFGEDNTDELIELYELKTAVTGPYKARVVLPYVMDGELVAWTARAIVPAEIRYKDLSVDDCLVEIKKTLYNHDAMIDGGEILLVQEGPVDALKVDFFGRERGVRSVALSTNSISDDQIYLIAAYASHFDQVVFMMDNATGLGAVDSWRMQSRVNSTIKNLTSPISVPFGLKDAGLMTPNQATTFTEQLLRNKRAIQQSPEHSLRRSSSSGARIRQLPTAVGEDLRVAGTGRVRRSFRRD